MNGQYTQELVPFHGTDIMAFAGDVEPMIAIKPQCDYFGLDWEGQRQRIKRDPWFSSTTFMIKAVGADGKKREMICLPLDAYTVWLVKIDTSRVKNPQAREMILAYQREAGAVLRAHFFLNRTRHEELMAIQSSKFMADKIELLEEVGVLKDERHKLQLEQARKRKPYKKLTLKEKVEAIKNYAEHNNKRRTEQELDLPKGAVLKILRENKDEIVQWIREFEDPSFEVLS